MYLLFDIGGTRMRLASSFDGQKINDTQYFLTPQDFEKGMKIIREFVLKADSSRMDIIGCCGLPGVFNKEKDMLINAQNLPFWVAKPIKKELEGMIHNTVYLENDADLAGLGEAVKGAGKGNEIVAYITVGTGVGGVRIVNGKIDKSTYGFEPGHQIIDADATIAGKLTDLEGLVAGVGIETRFDKKPEDINDDQVWQDAEKYLAIGLTNTILHWSPNIVVLGGGLIINERYSVQRIRSYISEYLKVFTILPDIKKGELGEDAGLQGAIVYLQGLTPR
ncbi:MAG: sugar kinase, glucokinase [Microgenomates group bacterium GW2011_GWC1_37_8]|uniref:ROK family protein n=1 Tax=Candidatus Woesebacteria bacterium GW2011_GWB1_38_8 TaxID=1618570 RepID=A0A0G0PAF2_9BACT|nr:MAG: sugar kinase, glucokinase [Microgenomates group bacterium GW2011_GWC1_37_8]KKQ86286.1 MAG: hypothetical protein UT08_C0001G0152 [Candidatus Woesebacteria bacterium GW2011_GWB1_38_8]